MDTNYYKLTCILLSCILFSCSDSIDFDVNCVINPNNISPLTGTITVTSEENGTIRTIVNGDLPIENTYEKNSKVTEIPLLGLYAGADNKVDIIFEKGGVSSKKTILVKTAELPRDFPGIEINKIDRNRMEPGFHACDFHMANQGSFHTSPFIFDDNGQVRWYLDLGFIKKMAGPFQKFKNGEIVVGTRTNIFKFDMFGNTIKKIDMNPQYGIHHDLVEMPDGKILTLVGKRNQPAIVNGEKMDTDNDFMILLEKDSPKVLKEWDNAKILDVNRNDLNTTRKNDWIHTNSVNFNPTDSTIVISGKNQGIIKHSWDEKLEWILGPHRNWGKAGRDGNGIETKDYLLTAVDSENVPYDDDVQMGTVSHEDFDFPWGQHAAKFLPNGNLILFDNGSKRNYQPIRGYSRVVEYEIDEEKKTVKQIWQYGKKRGTDLFSLIVSDVDYLPETGNILMTSGYIIDENKNQSSKIIEIDKNTNEEVFEATLTLKTLRGSKLPVWGQTDILYRSERIELK